jgi:hypothetical protein
MSTMLQALIQTVVLGLLVAVSTSARPARAADQPLGSTATGKGVRLKDQLEKGLKTRRPEERAFVAKVVRLVERGALSRRLVDGTFLWARSKPRHTFQYFRYALTIKARRRGIPL